MVLEKTQTTIPEFNKFMYYNCIASTAIHLEAMVYIYIYIIFVPTMNEIKLPPLTADTYRNH